MPDDSAWTNEALIGRFLQELVVDIYDHAAQVDGIRHAAADDNPNRLTDRLVELQMGVLLDVLTLLDGSRRIDGWPGIVLVNPTTGKPVRLDLAWELSRVEREYLSEQISVDAEE